MERRVLKQQEKGALDAACLKAAPACLVGRLFLSLKMLQNLLGRRWSEVGKRTEAWLERLERLSFSGASNGAEPPIWYGEPDINSRIPEILGDNR
jgi:hypothetical protein